MPCSVLGLRQAAIWQEKHGKKGKTPKKKGKKEEEEEGGKKEKEEKEELRYDEPSILVALSAVVAAGRVGDLWAYA